MSNVTGLVCNRCGDPDLLTVKPGTARETGNVISLAGDVPDIGWCASCAPIMFRIHPERADRKADP
jgi:hypothetical protein